MGNRELREWLGLTLGDLLMYTAAAALVAMYVIKDTTIDLLLAAAAVLLAVAASAVGMRRDPEVSAFTNVMKRVVYPVCIVLVLLFILIHYTFWPRWSAALGW